MRYLSGIQPSGTLHIANYFAMMKRMIHFQEKGELFCFIANLHSLTSSVDPKELRTQTMNAAKDFLALGLDPKKAVFWLQSDVPNVTELAWILSCLAPMGLLERCHSYKDKIAKGVAANVGLFTYPVLMTADILLFGSNRVPVGKDQKQHLEVARDIAIKFNNTYGEILTIPEEDIPDEIAVIPGTDGQKMSKSYKNTIDIFTDKAILKKQVMGIVTDSTPLEAPKDPDKCNLFAISKLFMSADEAEELRKKYRAGGLGYGTVKKELLERIWNYFAPYRELREKITDDEVMAVLEDGAARARKVAEDMMQKIKKAVGIS